MNKALIAIAVSLALPAYAKCGDDAVLATVEQIIRSTYFTRVKPPRPLELTMIRVVGHNSDLGIYRCSGVLEFPTDNWDIILMKGIRKTGANSRSFHFEVAPNAREPDKDIISLDRIRDLERDPNPEGL